MSCHMWDIALNKDDKTVNVNSNLPLLKQKDHKCCVLAEVVAAQHRGIKFKTKCDVAKCVAKPGKCEINQGAGETLCPHCGVTIRPPIQEEEEAVSGPVVRPADETRARCFTNGCLRIQHDLRRCNGIEMISSRSLNKSSLFRHFTLCAV